jgi:polyisoprenoid-binding protein YceI
MLKIILCLLLFYIPMAKTQSLIVKKGPINSIKFLANSSFINFEGTTSAIEGYISWDSTLTNSSRIEFKVYLDSLDTGIGLRNTHMRDKYLETSKYPLAEFTGSITNQIKKTNLESEVKVHGTLKIHGVERKQEIFGKIYYYGNLFKIESSFDIFLSDFNIEKPSFLFATVDNKMTLKCIIYLNKKNK